jgi:hypothetical protein
MTTKKTNIATKKLSDYKIIDIILKVWLAVLVVMWVIGMASLLYHLATDPSSIENATFGIFDTL